MKRKRLSEGREEKQGGRKRKRVENKSKEIKNKSSSNIRCLSSFVFQKKKRRKETILKKTLATLWKTQTVTAQELQNWNSSVTTVTLLLHSNMPCEAFLEHGESPVIWSALWSHGSLPAASIISWPLSTGDYTRQSGLQILEIKLRK